MTFLGPGGFTKDEIAFGDVGVGFIALLAGIFVGGILYARFGFKYSVMISLILIAGLGILVSLFWLRWAIPCNCRRSRLVSENFSSGIRGTVVVAYLSALCNLSFPATPIRTLVRRGRDRRPVPHRHYGGGLHRNLWLRPSSIYSPPCSRCRASSSIGLCSARDSSNVLIGSAATKL